MIAAAVGEVHVLQLAGVVADDIDEGEARFDETVLHEGLDIEVETVAFARMEEVRAPGRLLQESVAEFRADFIAFLAYTGADGGVDVLAAPVSSILAMVASQMPPSAPFHPA